MTRRPAARRSATPAVTTSRWRWAQRLDLRSSLVPLAIVTIVLLATIDDRHVGRAPDERQIVWTAIAVSETGQFAQARGMDFTYVRPDGQAISRYGLGMSLLEVPAAILAPAVERRMGPGASQPLFLIAPLLMVLLAAAFAGLAVSHLARSTPGGRSTAILLCGLGSPLGAYAAIAFSEPLQAAALAGAYAAALASSVARPLRSGRQAAALAGAFASLALLTKSSLVVVAPFALLPLLAPSTGRGKRDLSGNNLTGKSVTGSSPEPASPSARLAWAAAGFLPGAVVWLVFEMTRFGRPFASYPGEGFTHPFWDGCWRLLVGPNTGLVLFFPATLTVFWAVGRCLQSRDWDRLLRLSGGVLVLFGLVALAASWWAWDGAWGWGPRLIIPAIPVLAAVAATVMAAWPAGWRRAVVALSIAINAPGLLQHAAPVTNYYTNLAWPAAPAGIARSLAWFAWRLDAGGTYHVSPNHVLARVPQASPFISYPWFLAATWHGDATRAARALEAPPWRAARPDLVPAVRPMSTDFVRAIIGYPRARYWGRGFWPSPADAEYASVYDEGLANQVIRLQQQGDGAESLRFAQKLVGLAPFAWNDALVLESFRVLGDRGAAARYLSDLPMDRRAYPPINIVLALFERDSGNEAEARKFLGSVADNYPDDAPLKRALGDPLDRWPRDLRSMINQPIRGPEE